MQRLQNGFSSSHFTLRIYQIVSVVTRRRIGYNSRIPYR
jgi:hypothetical protein